MSHAQYNKQYNTHFHVKRMRISMWLTVYSPSASHRGNTYLHTLKLCVLQYFPWAVVGSCIVHMELSYGVSWNFTKFSGDSNLTYCTSSIKLLKTVAQRALFGFLTSDLGLFHFRLLFAADRLLSWTCPGLEACKTLMGYGILFFLHSWAIMMKSDTSPVHSKISSLGHAKK